MVRVLIHDMARTPLFTIQRGNRTRQGQQFKSDVPRLPLGEETAC